jgi:zinc transport system substrate-binding protein
MKKTTLILLLLLTIISATEKLTVVTTLFPLFDFAKTIGGELASVSLIIPPGVEPHAFEPTPKDVVKMSSADIFIYTDDNMEPWVKDIVTNLKKRGVKIVVASKGITLLKSSADKEETKGKEHHEEINHEHHKFDPHIWLDPIRAIKISENIRDGFISASPKDSKIFTDNGIKLKNNLLTLNNEIKTTVSSLSNKTIVTGGHFAFRYFADRYGLSYISPFKGFSPNSKPSPKDIVKIITTINDNGYKAIFFGELVESRVATTISKETGAKLYLLHGAHNVSRKELDNGITYISIMRDNLFSLKHLDDK